ncbi:transketolase C-terminal domain-containing protein [Vibrio sp. PP-XX7]
MGSTVHEIVEAAEKLAVDGVHARVISVPSIRPQRSGRFSASVKWG